MEVMQGKVNAEKEEYILKEQEKILSAETDLKEQQRKLYSGEITTGIEYTDSIMAIQSVLNKSEAFEMVFDLYKYAKKAPEKRFIMSAGELGFCRDYPDIAVLIFVIAYASIYFLTEESSQMITLIRACENSRKNTFISKLISFGLMILVVQFFSALCEFFFLYASLKNSINYPVQSLEYFGGCEYDITILQAFLLVQTIKLLGYFFISAIVVLLSGTIRKPVPVVSVPFVICFIQQFVFMNPDQGYYIPTGLLRATGYFRGDAYEAQTNFGSKITVKVFSAVPQSAMLCVILIALTFISFVYIIGYRYYKGKKYMFKLKSLFAILLIIVCMTGCNQSNNHIPDIYYNMCHSGRFPQSEDYYFDFYNELSDGRDLIAVNKSDGSSFKVVRNTFGEMLWADSCCLVGDELYFIMFLSSKSFTIYKTNLDTYKLEEIANQDISYSYSFWGLKFSDSVVINKSIYSFFTDGNSLFLFTVDSEIFQCDMDLKNSECIISDGIYDFQLVFTGEKIYYINNKLELVKYDIARKSSEIISENFVRAFDLSEDKIIYSGNDGIYCISLDDNTTKKISDLSADRIMIDKNKAVIRFNNSLYLLDIESKMCTPIYDGELVNFNIIKGNDLVLCTKFIYDEKRYKQFTIEI